MMRGSRILIRADILPSQRRSIRHVENAVSFDEAFLKSWIGRSEETADVITPRLVKMVRAALYMEPGEPAIGDIAPTVVHWCFILDIAGVAELGADGHPKRGGFLPPVPLPRRMWAGGQTEYVDRLRVGDEMRKTATISDVVFKTGNSGQLCFVTIDHTISTARGIAIRERQDVVFRGDATAGVAPAPKPAPVGTYQESLVADPVQLFRFSSIMFNGHRIHYDRPYATEVEGYAGLVVHGPLQAGLLVDMAEKILCRPLKQFTHRGVAPLFDGPFTLNANDTAAGLDLWTAPPSGQPAMKVTAS
jgi:3-methylfumaryl-CoA hydratase